MGVIFNKITTMKDHSYNSKCLINLSNNDFLRNFVFASLPGAGTA